MTISMVSYATAIGAAETSFFSIVIWPFKPEWFCDPKFGIRAHWCSQFYREQEWQSDVERAALARRPAGRG